MWYWFYCAGKVAQVVLGFTFVFWCGRLCRGFSSEVVSVLSVFRSVQRGALGFQVS